MIRAEFVEQYRHLSPLERNQELLGLYLMLPAPLFDEFPDDNDWISMPGMGRGLDEQDLRRKSETRHLLSEKLDSLLTLSHTTLCCQAYIHKDHSDSYISGIDKINITIGGIRGILFKEHNISPGVFAPESGKEMERAIYRVHVYGKLSAQRAIEELDKERGRKPQPPQGIPEFFEAILGTNPNLRFRDSDTYAQVAAGAEARVKNLRRLLEKWPNEFFNMHHEEI